MNREERIAWAREQAAATAPERARQREAAEAERTERIAAMGSVEASREANRLNQDRSIPWLGPVSTPYEWTRAVAAARDVAIEAAKGGSLITYGELRLAVFEASGMRLGHNQYKDLAEGVNRTSDGCLLSAIIVQKERGQPGAGLLPYACSQGFDEPVASLQREVFDRFGGAADGQ